jgi:hypothetical protein
MPYYHFGIQHKAVPGIWLALLRQTVQLEIRTFGQAICK